MRLLREYAPHRRLQNLGEIPHLRASQVTAIT
jgi:hypothetical protein